MATNLVGLDIGAHTIRAAVVSSSGDRVRVKKLVSCPMPKAGLVNNGMLANNPQSISELATTLAELWDEHKLPKDVILGVQAPRAIRDILMTVRAMPARTLRSSLPRLIQEQGLLSVGGTTKSRQYMFDFVPLGKKDTPEGAPAEMDILAVGVDKERVEPLLSALREAGLRTVGMDISTFAALRTYPVIQTPEGAVDVLVDIGASSTRVLFCTNGTPVALGSSEVSGDGFSKAAADKLGVSMKKVEEAKLNDSAMEALQKELEETFGSGAQDAKDSLARQVPLMAAEVARCIRSFVNTSKNHSEVGRVVLIGGASNTPDLDSYLSAELEGSPVTNKVELSPEMQKDSDPQMWITAIGLGTGASA